MKNSNDFDIQRVYLRLSILLSVVAFIFPRTGIMDKAFLFLILFLTYKFSKKITKFKDQCFLGILHLSITTSFIFSLDKVSFYPNSDNFELKIPLYMLLGFIHFHIIKGLANFKLWKVYGLSLLCIYMPITKIPADVSRQVIGNLITNPDRPVYFTKFQPNNLYGVYVHDRRQPVYFSISSNGYDQKNDASFVDGGGSMERQSIIDSITFRILRIIH
jgi:hypothetical protein